MTPLERAAKAAREETSAYAVDGGWMTEGGVVGDDHWEDIARAVLQAIREPSEAMISAGSEVEFAERSWPGGEDNVSNGVQKGPPIGVEEGPPFRII